MITETTKPRGTYLTVEASGLADTHTRCMLDYIIATVDDTIKHCDRLQEECSG